MLQGCSLLLGRIPGCATLNARHFVREMRHVASPCIFFHRGFCRFGDFCRFSHADVAALEETLPFEERHFVHAQVSIEVDTCFVLLVYFYGMISHRAAHLLPDCRATQFLPHNLAGYVSCPTIYWRTILRTSIIRNCTIARQDLLWNGVIERNL